MNARQAVGELLQEHATATLHLKAIVDAWGTLDPASKVLVATDYPNLVTAIIKATGTPPPPDLTAAHNWTGPIDW